MPINRVPFNALIDDDGSNLVGTLWNKDIVKTVILDPADLAFGVQVQTITLTGVQNSLVLLTGSMFLTLRCNNATDLTITGMVAGFPGQRVRIEAVGAGNVFLLHQNAGSAAANQLLNACTSAASPLAASVGAADYSYDAIAGRWRLVTHNQGAAIPYTPIWTAPTTNPTLGNGSIIGSYLLYGRLMDVFLQLAINTTTNQGSGQWSFSLPIPMVGVPPVGSGFVTSGGGNVTNPIITTITGFYHPAGDIIGILCSNNTNVGSGSPPTTGVNDVFRGACFDVSVA